MYKHIGIIGAGNMGSAFYKSLETIFPKEILHICDHNSEKIQNLDAINTYTTNLDEMINRVEIIILAIKPQTFKEIKLDLSSKFVISIMAGISLSNLQQTGSDKVIRSMPNLPIQVGEGTVGWIASKLVTEEEKIFVQQIFQTMGQEIELEDENMINTITALSGTGPAYFFYLTELLAKVATDMGLSKDHATALSKNTLIGSAKLLADSSKTPEDWRKAVTSKGGTTAAAMAYFEDNNFVGIFTGAVKAAKKRSEELNI